jgi:hypothetical protein
MRAATPQRRQSRAPNRQPGKAFAPSQPRCACGEWATFRRGDEAFCGKCAPAEFFPRRATP